MRIFERPKTAEEIRSQVALVPGLIMDTKLYDLGSDRFTVRSDHPDWKNMGYVIYAPFNGSILGMDASSPGNSGVVFNELSTFDGEPWFDAIMDFFYVQTAPG